MSFLHKLILIFCVFAGMAIATVCKYDHFGHEACVKIYSHEHHHHHGENHTQPEEDCEDHDRNPHHHHHCLQLPVADSPSLDRHAIASFNGRLLEISTERSLIPDRPFFALDKPPLI